MLGKDIDNTCSVHIAFKRQNDMTDVYHLTMDTWGDSAVVVDVAPCTDHSACNVLTVAPDIAESLEYVHADHGTEYATETNGSVTYYTGITLVIRDKATFITPGATFTCNGKTASDVGVFILRASGSASSWADGLFPGTDGTLLVTVEDGEVFLSVAGAERLHISDDSEVIDLARRLIVFGGTL